MKQCAHKSNYATEQIGAADRIMTARDRQGTITIMETQIFRRSLSREVCGMTKDEAIEALQVAGNIAPEYKNSPFFNLYLRIKVDDAAEIAEFINQQAEQIERMKNNEISLKTCCAFCERYENGACTDNGKSYSRYFGCGRFKEVKE